MIREIKKQARQILLKNYTSFLLPTFLYIFANFVKTVSLSVFFGSGNLLKVDSMQTFVSFAIYLIFQLFISPLSVFLIFKTTLGIVDETAESGRLLWHRVTFNEVAKIGLIWLIPNMLRVVYSLLDGVFGFDLFHESTQVAFAFGSLLFSLLIIYSQYKFLACHYYFALNQGKAAEIVGRSFKTMKGALLKYLLVDLSFFHWYLLAGVLALIFTKLFSTNGLLQNALISLGWGVYLLLVPYVNIFYTLFVKRLHEDSAK